MRIFWLETAALFPSFYDGGTAFESEYTDIVSVLLPMIISASDFHKVQNTSKILFIVCRTADAMQTYSCGAAHLFTSISQVITFFASDLS